MADPEQVQGESIGGLLRGILTDVRTLIHEEIALARVEIRDQAGRARKAALSLGIAVAGLASGGMFLLVAAAVALADMMDWPVWAGFLVVAALLTLLGFIAWASGRRQLRNVPALPQETMSRLKENSEWIARRLSSVRK